jgi:hypothetical protein
MNDTPTPTPRTDDMRQRYSVSENGGYKVEVIDIVRLSEKLERELTAMTEQRDEARRLAEKYRHLSCDSLDEADETLLPWETTNPNEL